MKQRIGRVSKIKKSKYKLEEEEEKRIFMNLQLHSEHSNSDSQTPLAF